MSSSTAAAPSSTNNTDQRPAAAPVAASPSASLPGFAPAAPVPPPANPVPPLAVASTQLATTDSKVGSVISAAAAEAQPKPKSILRGSGSGGITEKAKNKEEKVKKWVTAPANTKKIVLPPRNVAEPAAAAEPKAGNTADKPDAKPAPKPAPAVKSPPASASSAKESAGTPGLDISPTPRDRHGKRTKKMAAKSALKPPTKRPEASNKKKDAPKKKKTTAKARTPGIVKRDTKKRIYHGPPLATDAIDGIDFTGWLKESYERAGGATVGRPDHYWYTPKQRFQLRSKAEIKRFCAAMLKEKDEEKAAKIATNRTTAPPRLDASKK